MQNQAHILSLVKKIMIKYPKFKTGDSLIILKYKNIFAKGQTPNWSEAVSVIKKVKNTVPWTYVINDLNGKKIVGIFYKKELQKANQKEFRIEIIIITIIIIMIHLIVGLIKKYIV